MYLDECSELTPKEAIYTQLHCPIDTTTSYPRLWQCGYRITGLWPLPSGPVGLHSLVAVKPMSGHSLPPCNTKLLSLQIPQTCATLKEVLIPQEDFESLPLIPPTNTQQRQMICTDTVRGSWAACQSTFSNSQCGKTSWSYIYPQLESSLYLHF